MSSHGSVCEEIHVYGGVAERTGVTIDLKGYRHRPNVCTSITDLVRKHKLMGDGHFYLHGGQWPEGQTSVLLGGPRTSLSSGI
jgi:hypothetical protein